MQEDMDSKKDQTSKSESLVHDFNDTKNLKILFSSKLAAVFIGVTVLGLISGYLLASRFSMTSRNSTIDNIFNNSSVSKGIVVGSNDTATFKDTAEGVLKQGGIDGEGAFHLERNGGPSQNVYLTSSIVDLSKFIGKKVKVWGQTQKAQTAGWLMDVGRVEVL